MRQMSNKTTLTLSDLNLRNVIIAVEELIKATDGDTPMGQMGRQALAETLEDLRRQARSGFEWPK